MDSQGSFYGDGQGIAERASPSSRPQSQWLTPLQSVSASHSPYASPTSASPSLSEAPFPGFFHQQSTGQQSLSTPQPSLPRSSSSVSLNLSSLSVSSPTSHPSTAGSVSSPITPLTPSANATPQAHSFTSGQPLSLPSLAPQHQPPSFRFNLPDPSSSSSPFDYPLSRDPASSRSSTSSDKSIPRKRSLQTVTPLSTNIEESVNMSNNGLFEQTLHGPHTGHSHHSQRPSTTIEIPGTGYGDDGDLSSYGNGDPMGSPMDDSPSSPHFPDESKTSLSNIGPTPSGIPINATKPSTGANNFVNKLYIMISDTKSAQFISWTEHGTSFVVNNVGEFSRSILGAHFKHNNFSSFVRQLNMYGFSKINRTPRAQRASADAQTWEFAHPKFLRGRPDLLEEIRRKAMEPDPTLKQRVELPGELAAQLGQLRDDNRKLVRALDEERNRGDRLTTVVKMMYEVVAKTMGQLPMPFPHDLLDSGDNPPIFITSPANSTPYSASGDNLYPMHTLSPNSSPTTTEFSHSSGNHHQQHHQQQQSLHNPQRGLSLPQIVTGPFPSGSHSLGLSHVHSLSTAHPHSRASPTPSPISAHELDNSDFSFNGGSRGYKRQRVGHGHTLPDPITGQGSLFSGSLSGSVSPMNGHHDHNPGGLGGGKRLARARSDSAPLGQALGVTWSQNRPRSGSGIAGSSTGGHGSSGLAFQAPLINIPNVPPITRESDARSSQ